MRTVLITFAERPVPGYPIAVVILNDDPNTRVPRSQEHLVRSVRDGRLFANGMCAGAGWALNGERSTDQTWPVNPTLDPRLKDVD